MQLGYTRSDPQKTEPRNNQSRFHYLCPGAFCLVIIRSATISLYRSKVAHRPNLLCLKNLFQCLSPKYIQKLTNASEHQITKGHPKEIVSKLSKITFLKNLTISVKKYKNRTNSVSRGLVTGLAVPKALIFF